MLIDLRGAVCDSINMQIARWRQGFTIIELIIVIVVIAILATITSTMYLNSQVQARDLKMMDTGDKVADAILLFNSREGHFPRGGLGSTTPIGTGKECANGANGFANPGTYTCAVAETLIASGYIPADLFNDIAPNPYYLPNNAVRYSMAVYNHGLPTGNFVGVYYSLENPSPADTERFNNVLRKCGMDPAGTVYVRDSLGMRGGTCVQL